MKRIYFIIFLGIAVAVWTILPLPVVAQPSAGGTPPSFRYQVSGFAKQQASGMVTLAAPDVKSLLTEDNRTEAQDGLKPSRMGILIPNVNITMNNNGTWTDLNATEKVWRVSVHAPGAVGLALYYDKFYLPEGSKLFIYNKDRSHILGAYDHTTNLSGGSFVTEQVHGDYLTLEYVAPTRSIAGREPQIEIASVGYVYRKLNDDGSEISRAGYNTSGFSCLININCPDGAAWQDQKKGIVKFMYPVGNEMYYATGCVINNTAQNFKPYILTAYHNFMNSTESEVGKLIIYFEYETRGCSMDAKEPTPKSLVGARRLAWNNIGGGSDGCLLELFSTIPSDWDVYYNGWDASNFVPTDDTLVGIHHPNGDAKKISFFNSAQISLFDPAGSIPCGQNGHISLLTIKSPIEGKRSNVSGGSSGSPLFRIDPETGEKVIIGTLTGSGGSNCNSAEAIAWYGRVWAHWDQFITSGSGNTAMKSYLDPLGLLTGEKRLCKGSYRVNPGSYKADFMATVRDITVTRSVTFTNLSKYPADNEPTYYWEFEGGSPTTSTAKNPTVMYNTDGEFFVKLTINKGLANENAITRAKYISVKDYTDACTESFYSSDPANDDGKSMFPLGIIDQQVMSLALYTADEIGGTGRADRESYIQAIGWIANEMNLDREAQIYLANTDLTTLSSVTADSARRYMLANGALVSQINSLLPVTGENLYQLPTSFKYTPGKNLLVLVRIRKDSYTGIIDPQCPYTNKPGKHQSWLLNASDRSLLDAIGTVDEKRPIIKIVFKKYCIDVPKAVYRMYSPKPTPYYIENFDANEFIPSGWTQLEPITAAAWKISKDRMAEWRTQFQTTNRMNIASQAINSKNIEPASRIASPEFNVEESVYLQYYLGYNGGSLGAIQFNTYIAVDGDLNNLVRADSTYPYTRAATAYEWHRRQVDLSPYIGKKIRIVFENKPLKPYTSSIFNIDEISLWKTKYTPESLNIYEGDTVVFQTTATGSPIDYNWTISSTATTITSSSKNPSFILTKAGEYDVKLRVKNALGAYDTTAQKAINVTAREPQAGYKLVKSGVNGYFVRSDDQNQRVLLMPGAQAVLAGNARNHPQSYNWTLPSAQVTSTNVFTQQDLGQFTYLEEGTYSLSLKVSNTNAAIPADKQESTITVPDFAYVGPNYAKHIWNIPAGEDGLSLVQQNDPSASEPAYYTGISLDRESFRGLGERFNAPAVPGQITEIAFCADVLSITNQDAVITCALFSEGIPETANASPVGFLDSLYCRIEIPVKNIKSGGLVNYVSLPEPVGLTTDRNYYVIFYIDNDMGADVVFRSSKKQFPAYDWSGLAGTAIIGTKLIYNGNEYVQWQAYSDMFSWGVSLNVSAKFQYSQLELDKTYIKKSTTNDVAKPVGVITNGMMWQATCDQDWVELGNAKQTGSGNFTVRCKDNADGPFREAIITITGGGQRKTMYVQQPGGPPTNLTATLVKKSMVDLQWTALAAAQTDDIFDNFESGYEPYAINPAGKVGWAYFDGDGDETFSIPNSTVSYSGKGVPKAFMHFTPPISSEALKAHSGKSYLVSFAALSGKNDDWLISPRFNFGQAARIEFYAKSMSANYAKERFTLYYSTTGNAREDFKNAVSIKGGKGYEEVSADTWTKYMYEIPKAARYVAVVCISENGSALMLDDIFIGKGLTPETTTANSAPNPTQEFLNRNVVFNTALLQPIEKMEFIDGLVAENSSSEEINVAKNTVYQQNINRQAVTQKMLRWGNGLPLKGVGWGSGGYLTIASKFAVAHLTKYANHKLVAVDYMLHSSNGVRELSIVIWSGNQVMYEQEIPNVESIPTKVAQRVILNTPVDIDITKDFYIGLSTKHEIQGTPFSFDTTSFSKNYSDLYIMSMTQENQRNLSYMRSYMDNTKFGVAWNIAGIVEGETPGYVYNIYRDNAKIATTRETSYTDAAKPTKRQTTYTVTMVYDDPEMESNHSNQAIVIEKSPITITADNKIRMTKDPNPEFTFTYSGDFVNGDDAATLSTKLNIKGVTTADVNSPAGKYPIKVEYTGVDDYEVSIVDGILSVTEQIPSAIIPGGSSADNSIFLPGIPVQIFNRNGTLIKDSADGWDGTDKNGKVVAPGVYYYNATFTSGSRKGSVEVIKY